MAFAARLAGAADSYTRTISGHSLRFKISNGKTLCAICHSAVHGHKPMAAGRHCVDCGKSCTNKNRQGKPRCRSCGVKHWHSLGRPREQENTERYRQQALPL